MGRADVVHPLRWLHARRHPWSRRLRSSFRKRRRRPGPRREVGCQSYRRERSRDQKERTFRGLTEADCLQLSAANAGSANLLDEENRVPQVPKIATTGRPVPADASVSYGARTAQSCRGRRSRPLLPTRRYREPAPICCGKHSRSSTRCSRRRRRRKRQGRAFPARSRRPRTATIATALTTRAGRTRLAIAESRSEATARSPLPFREERLWPSGDFEIDPTPIDPDEAVTAALADRPELRGLRNLARWLDAGHAAGRARLSRVRPAHY